MIFICNHCGRPIAPLRTTGDEIIKDLICPQCAKELQSLLKRAKEIQTLLNRHFLKID